MEETGQKIAEQIKQIIADQLCIKVEDIENKDNLVSDHGADSLDVVEISMEIESEFKIEVPFHDEEPEPVVSSMIEYYTNLILGGAGSHGTVTH